MHHLRRRTVRRRKKDPCLVQRLANEQSSYAHAALGHMSKAHMHALHSNQLEGLDAGASSPFLLSLPLLLFIFLILSLLSSSFRFVFKTRFGGARARKAAHGWYGGHLWPICGLCARVNHFYCAQKLRNLSSGEAKTKIPTKSTSARKLKKMKDKLSVSQDIFYGMFDA